MFNKIILSIIAISFLISCNSNNKEADASGTFEADEIIVSAEGSGRILNLNIQEGDTIGAGKIVGSIDNTNLQLQKDQINASIGSLSEKTNDPNPQIAIINKQIAAQKGQIAVQQEQIATLQREKSRIEKLLKAEAATPKQLDDIVAQLQVATKQMNVLEDQINVSEQQIEAQRAGVGIQNRAILSERAPLQKRVSQLDDQIKRCNITNPIAGTVLVKYADAGELTNMGKAIYKIADLRTMTLRAYVTGDQLSKIKLGQQVTVRIDDGADKFRNLQGIISWIANKAEFTPKTVLTKDERSSLVYAVKVRVSNDGYLKIGMPAEVVLTAK